MASFAELRKKQNPIEQMQAKLKAGDKTENKNNIEDDTYWSMNHLRGEDGTGYAVIRFLPAPENEDDSFVTFHEHIFQGESHWYVNRSRMTLGSNERDPVWEHNGKFFKDKSLSDEARKKLLLPRKVNYVSNILVVEDPVKPENNGKVFRFKYGPQIFNLINEAGFPKFGAKPIPVFDPIDGANFTIRVYTKRIGNNDVPTYEKSSFNEVSAICALEDFDAIWAKQYSLAEIVAKDKFPPYAELKLRFDLVMGNISEEEYNNGLADLKDGFMAPQSRKDAPKQTAAPKEERVEPAKTLKEEMDDDIPFSTSEAIKIDAGTDEDGGDDDWFAALKK